MSARLLAVHPVLMARDLEASVRFYERLGFTLVFQDDPAEPRYAAIRRDDIELHLQWHAAQQWDPEMDRPAYRILVQDVDALFLEYQDALGQDLNENRSPWRKPGDTPWGTREFHLGDPDQNGLQFYQMR